MSELKEAIEIIIPSSHFMVGGTESRRKSAGLSSHSVLLVEQDFSAATGSVVSPEHVFVNSGEVRRVWRGQAGV